MEAREWLRIDKRRPGQNQKVWFWFEVSKNVFGGTYRQGSEEHGVENIFMDAGGFLGDDVTYWMPRDDDNKPEPPTIPQRELCLYHSELVDDPVEDLIAACPIKSVNRSHKTKTKKGSGCAMCKPRKHGWGPSNDIKTIAEMESAVAPNKWPAAAKSKPRKAWRVATYYGYSIKKPWGFRKYLDETDAREAFEALVKKAIKPFHYKLLNPDGDVADERKEERDPV